MNTTPYFRPAETSYAEGANLDLRARISLQLITFALSQSGMQSMAAALSEGEPAPTTPRGLAVKVCDIANALIDEWGAREWIKGTPTTEEQVKICSDIDILGAQHRQRAQIGGVSPVVMGGGRK